MVISEKLRRKKLCVEDLIGPYSFRKDRPKFNIRLNMFVLNPPAQKVYITHQNAMATVNLVDIFCKTDYNH